MTKQEQLIQWLGDAHAMEVGIVSAFAFDRVKPVAQPATQPSLRV